MLNIKCYIITLKNFFLLKNQSYLILNKKKYNLWNEICCIGLMFSKPTTQSSIDFTIMESKIDIDFINLINREVDQLLTNKSKISASGRLVGQIKKGEQLFLSRDHAGIKPLYYSQNNGVIVFGSEAKGLLDIVPGSRNIDHTAFTCWNISGLNVSNHSFFKGIKKLMPGETLRYDIKTKKLIQVKRNIILGGKGL